MTTGPVSFGLPADTTALDAASKKKKTTAAQETSSPAFSGVSPGGGSPPAGVGNNLNLSG